MPSYICIKCGRKIKSGFICTNCENKSKENKKLKPKKYITICKECGRYKINKKWITPHEVYESLEDMLKDVVHAVHIQHIKGNNYIAKSNDKEQIIEVNYGICDECSRYFGGYYEAIIQLRGSKKFVESKEREIEHDITSSSMPRNFISKIEKVKGGKDIYVGSKKIAKKIFKRMDKKKYILKQSFMLHTVKDGKRITRDVYLIKEKGDHDG